MSSYSLSLKLAQFMNAFDTAMNLLDEKFSFLASTKQIVSSTNEEDKVQICPWMINISFRINYALLP
jgi:hypothetical protein